MYAVMLIILLFISLLAKHVKTSKRQISFKQYAHSVFIHYPGRLKTSEGLLCGGSLILAQVVVTSADCLKQMKFKNRITVYFGSSDPSRAKAKVGVLSYKIHPKFDKDNITYNLAVVFLSKPPIMGPYIGKIILPVGSRLNTTNSDEYAVAQPKRTTVIKSQLPELVKVVHDIAEKSYARQVVSGAVTHPFLGILRPIHKKAFQEEVFMVAWTKKSASVSSSSPL